VHNSKKIVLIFSRKILTGVLTDIKFGNIEFDKIKDLDILTILNYDTVRYYRNRENIVYNSEFKPIGSYDPITKELTKFVEET
jgi:hypothetical protein